MMFQKPPPPVNLAPKPMAAQSTGNNPVSASTRQPQELATQDPKGPGFGGRNQPITFDGKRMRKAVMRRTIDYNASVIKLLETRKWFKNPLGRLAMQPDESYFLELLPPASLVDNPINAVTTKFVRTSTNKLRCPIFCVVVSWIFFLELFSPAWAGTINQLPSEPSLK